MLTPVSLSGHSTGNGVYNFQFLLRTCCDWDGTSIVVDIHRSHHHPFPLSARVSPVARGAYFFPSSFPILVPFLFVLFFFFCGAPYVTIGWGTPTYEHMDTPRSKGTNSEQSVHGHDLKIVLTRKIGKNVFSLFKTCAFRYQISQNMCFDIAFCTGSGRRTPALQIAKNLYGIVASRGLPTELYTLHTSSP